MANFPRSRALIIIVIMLLASVVVKDIIWISTINRRRLSATINKTQLTAGVDIKHSIDADAKKRKHTDDHHIRTFLKPPNHYRIVNNADRRYSQAHQDETVFNILPIKTGFFVELGAFNGRELSNTLWLERKHNWTGLLIEANPDLCKQIEKVKRMAWQLCACVSKDLKAIFLKGHTIGGVENTLNERIARDLKRGGHITVPCFTLLKVLSVIGQYNIDYFSLDVEGAEFLVLESMKEDLQARHITVKVWTIEYRIYDGSKNLIPESAAKLNQLRSFFREIGGYTEHSQLGSRNKADGYSLDVVFVRNDIYHEYCKRYHSRPDSKKCKVEK